MRRRALLFAMTVLLAVGTQAPSALADGDPGSDVLVYQSLFLASDAGVSIQQQVRLGRLLASAGRSRFPIRVAIIASRFDLGAVTGLWLAPRAYARFLGIELSLAYNGPLLVVMPNGFGFNWPGHPAASFYRALSGIPIRPGGTGLTTATQAAVTALAATEHVKIAAPSPASSGTTTGATHGGAGTATAARHSGDGIVIIGAALAAVAAAATAVLLLRSRIRTRPIVARVRSRVRRRRARPLRRGRVLVTAALVVLVGLPILALSMPRAPTAGPSDALATNPYVDPGTRLSGPAPGFTLTDEFGHTVSLHSFRGKVVILAFNDSECTTICPLTTTAMLAAKRMLGAASSQVQLLGVDANPKATALQDVLSYSQLHGMLGEWRFLTGSLSQLKLVWSAYHIEAAIEAGQIAHTPAVYVIDPRGKLAKIYTTQQSYASIDQQAQVIANETSALLPNHPRVHSALTYTTIPTITPADRVALPRAGGGTIRLGPGQPHLELFFATWDQETTSLAGRLETLNQYQTAAISARLPALTAVDEASVEPSPAALTHFLRDLPRSLSFPVAIDQTGRVADGYEVQGDPWFVLSSPSGRILWYWAVASSGWPSPTALAHDVRAALSPAPRRPASLAAAQQELAGSPAPLAALHQQAARLLGTQRALAARIRALRGYPIVINAWASWCPPCRSEVGLFATASAHYGHRVAFLGADTDDFPGDAHAFLTQHPVSYPSYQITTTDLASLAATQGLPTTIFINRTGRVAYVHIGQYDSQGSLDGDIETYALGGGTR